MGFFTFILCFLVFLLIIIIIGSVEQFTLFIVVKKKVEFVVIIIPAILSLVLFVSIFAITTVILNVFNINTLNIVYSMLMNWEYSFNNYIIILLAYFASTIFFILLQALCLKLINIDYIKIGNFIKYKILKKEEIKSLSASEDEENIEGKVSINLTNNELPKPKEKSSYFYYLAASLLTFSIFFFSIMLFIYIGIVVGQNYMLGKI